MEEAGTFPNSAYEASITLIPKPKVSQENYRPILLINIGAKIFKQAESSCILKAAGIFPRNESVIYPRNDQVGFIPGMKVWFNIQNPSI